MNNKVLVGTVAVIIVVAAVVAIGFRDDEPNVIGVVYDGNGGVDLSGKTTLSDTSNTVDTSFFTRDGMVFLSWNTMADGSGTTYNPGDHIDYPSNGHVTLYAQWAYSLNAKMTPGPLTFELVNAEGIGSAIHIGGVALPSDGRAGILVLGPEGITWSHDKDSGNFTGKIDNTTFTLLMTFEGANVEKMDLLNGQPMVLFTYDGPVYADLTYLVSN